MKSNFLRTIVAMLLLLSVPVAAWTGGCFGETTASPPA